MFPRKRKLGSYDPEEEARLERIIFGDVSGVIDKLPEDHIEEANKSTTVYLDEVNDEDNEGDVKFQIDIVSKSSDENSDEDEQTEKKKRVWIDEDDEKYTVETAFDIQNRKISSQRPEKCYMDYLEKKYKHFVGNPKWAEINRVPDNSDDIDNEILKHSSHLETPQLKDLPKGKIDIKAMKPINQKTFSEGPKVSSLEFHPTSTLALVAGSSGILSLFQIDGIENNKLYSTRYKHFPISKAKFLKEGTEVILGSQFYSYCHSYDLISGKTHKIPLPSHITNMKKYEVSPDGRLIALCGRLGDIYLLTSSTKELIGTLKMNTKCRTISFIDNKKLVTHGDGHEMYIWDINSRTCIHRAVDDGCLSCSVTAISPNSQYLATGSREGIVNLYDLNKLLQAKYPVPLKIVSNFVTSISALKFNPTSEILAMASDKKANAFRMLHLPSFNVFSNFPTFQTTISMPCDIDFSPSSGYLGISNLSYKAFLYRLKHYGNY
ncbi:PREDICTED: U3 small nucleolar RNA-associated protein 18 homolog isoform X1 [Polistes dominula]|uniref:U3 small nucleolar RNA-associated protein 18 homolog isoform X1 n=1 Tax=Polistes dominula TaxID=743375 RepID=A0ABM1IC16_POLDO|nr:PREDICTED: U3 small nucleolar RNA-associated protein 18 homolog isoform X1 [Polistes dominula]